MLRSHSNNPPYGIDPGTTQPSTRGPPIQLTHCRFRSSWHGVEHSRKGRGGRAPCRSATDFDVKQRLVKMLRTIIISFQRERDADRDGG